MRFLTVILGAMAAFAVASTPSRFEVESQIKNDLESLLSRVIDRNQFVVTVHASFKNERRNRVIEGERLVPSPQSKVNPPALMPGFFPVEDKETPIERTSRERYEMEFIPVLTAVVVNTMLDKALEESVLVDLRQLVTDYVLTRYPDQGQARFQLVAMRLKPKSKKEPERALASVKAPEPEIDEWQQYLPWILVLLLALYLFVSGRRRPRRSRRYPQATPFGAPAYAGMGFPGMGTFPNAPVPQGGKEATNIASNPVQVAAPQGVTDDELVHTFLNTVIRNAEEFRVYYLRLEKDQKAEVESLLAGPAFESLMDALEVDRVKDGKRVSNVEETVRWHETQFNDFVNAANWQNKQFFGFLSGMGKEQLIGFSQYVDDGTLSIVMRFLKPEQSASLLDNLPPERKAIILHHLPQARQVPITQVTAVENQLRDLVKRLPGHILSRGKTEPVFWGEVLDYSSDSKSILSALEKASPQYGQMLQRYRYGLEELSGLPPQTINRVLAELDNEQVAAALSTCPKDVQQRFLEALSSRRRDVVGSQINLLKSDLNLGKKARALLTRKLREKI